MSQNDHPEAPSPATAANGSAAAKEENPAARALVSSSKAEAESKQGAQSGGVRRLVIDVLPSGFHRAGEVPSAEHAQCATNTSISSRFASCRKSYMTMFGILVMHDLTAASQGSSEPEAKWFDLFSSRYRKVVSVGAALFLFQQFATSMEDLEPLRLFQYTIWLVL
ncbi:hypothetical protein HN51_066052 [Arachis hypogaea]